MQKSLFGTRVLLSRSAILKLQESLHCAERYKSSLKTFIFALLVLFVFTHLHLSSPSCLWYCLFWGRWPQLAASHYQLSFPGLSLSTCLINGAQRNAGQIQSFCGVTGLCLHEILEALVFAGGSGVLSCFHFAFLSGLSVRDQIPADSGGGVSTSLIFKSVAYCFSPWPGHTVFTSNFSTWTCLCLPLAPWQWVAHLGPAMGQGKGSRRECWPSGTAISPSGPDFHMGKGLIL